MPLRRALQPLQRQTIGKWHAVAIRAMVAAGLVFLAFLLLWFDRAGLRDNIDGHMSVVDVIYFTMITVSTVGYGDIVPVTERARLIDAFLITPIRIFLWLIFLGTAFEFLIKHSWENWRMSRIQRTLTDHVILAGYGRTGQQALDELLATGRNKRNIVVIDNNAESIELAKAVGVVTIRGDATRDEVQRAVHIERAGNIIISCGRDDTSILTALTARQLAPNVRVAITIRNSDNEDIARQAGANVVINPVRFAGLLLATTSKGEHLADYLTDLATTRGNVLLREREASRDEVGQLLSEIRGGRAVRLYRGKEVLCPDDVDPPRVEAGDIVLEIARKKRV